jgi:hypothetical protein
VRAPHQNYDIISHAFREILDGSNITIDAKSKFNLFGKYEALAKVSGEEAMEAFWDSRESLSCAWI